LGGLEFISSLVGSLAWPVAVVTLVAITRKPLSKMLGKLSERSVKKFEAGATGVKIEYFDEKLEEARTELEEARIERPDLSIEQPVLPPSEPAKVPGSVYASDFMYEMRQLAEVAPSAAVLESYARLERVLRETLETDTDKHRRPAYVRELVRRAVEKGLIAPSEALVFDDVAVLRNLVAHSSTADLDVQRALSYCAIIGVLIESLTRGRTTEEGPA